MRRRRFLWTLGQTAAGLGVLSRRAVSRGPPAALSNWAWVHGGRERSAPEWRERFARLRRVGFNGVLVSGGDTRLLADAAHSEGLAFHRWIWVLNRNGDELATSRHPEWFTVSRNGASSLEHPPYVGYYKWVCPTREPVRAYLAERIDQIAREPGVDGVHLDYIRFPDVILPVGLWSRYNLVQNTELAEFDFCYCEVCRATFRHQTGVDPMELEDAPSHIAWREFRWDAVTALVNRLAEVVRARGKMISAAVFPTPTIARRLVRQAWEQWPLDAVFPMVYHEFYEEDIGWIGAATREGVLALAGRAPLHSGLYLPSLSPDGLGEAVSAARQGGAAGVACFEMDGLTDDHLARFAEAVVG